MVTTHLPIKLCLWNKSRHRVNHDELNFPGLDNRLDYLKSLFATVWLRNVDIRHLHTDVSGIFRI